LDKYAELFVDVCTTVFKNLGKVDIKADRPYVSSKDAITEWDISAIIGLGGETQGAVVISMKKNLALRVAEQFSGEHNTELNDDVVDVIGEIVNVIAGNAKQRLENEFALVISLPTIVRGESFSLSWIGGQPRIVCIPFTIFDKEKFILSVTINQK
jgi:chemotaxis protein CheX